MLDAAGAGRNCERCFWWLLEHCGGEPGRYVGSYPELVAASRVTSETSARRAIQKLEAIGLVRVDREARRLVVDVMRPWQPSPQKVFEFAEGPRPLPPSAPLRLQVAALAETLPDPPAKPRVEPPRRAPERCETEKPHFTMGCRAAATAAPPPAAEVSHVEPPISSKAKLNQRLAELSAVEPQRLARGSLSHSQHSQYLDPLTFSHSLSHSENVGAEDRSNAAEARPPTRANYSEPPKSSPPATTELAQRIVDRHERLFRRLEEPRLFPWMTLLCAYLVETGKVPEAAIEDVVYSCQLTVQDGRQRRPGVTAGRLFGPSIKRRLMELGRWLPIYELKPAVRSVGVVWQEPWDNFKPGGNGR
jgi:hypothetical protein